MKIVSKFIYVSEKRERNRAFFGLFNIVDIDAGIKCVLEGKDNILRRNV